MKRQLEAVIEELRRLKGEEGVRTVSLEPGRLEGWRRVLRRKYGEHSAGSESAAPRPKPSERLPELPVRDDGAAPRKRAKAAAKPASARAPAFSVTPPRVELPDGDKHARWEALREQVMGCAVCREHARPGCRVVFGVGDLDADLFFVGEAPGAEEEKQGEPFVGPAGQLLNRIIGAMGLKREQVYIGNIMNWRPETPNGVGNRPPTPEEMAFCLPYLRAQIAVVQPKILVALGSTAISGLLGPDPKRRMGKARGTWETFDGIPLMMTYHPSYVLRYASVRVKRMVWEDMLKVMERAGYPISDKQRQYFSKES